MLHPIREVLTGKGELCRELLESLPDWFGIPAAIDRYVHDVADLPVFAVGHEGHDVGFVALRWSFDQACEIYVMAVRAEHHHSGMGRALVDKAVDFAQSHGSRLLYVKTLGPSHTDPHYARTREFYQAVGFIALEELDGVFDPGNPCLIMVRSIGSFV